MLKIALNHNSACIVILLLFCFMFEYAPSWPFNGKTYFSSRFFHCRRIREEREVNKTVTYVGQSQGKGNTPLYGLYRYVRPHDPKGYGFLPALVRNRVSILVVLVVWFQIEFGFFTLVLNWVCCVFRRSYFFVIRIFGQVIKWYDDQFLPFEFLD